jgi:prophage regulatory protein
VQQDPSQPQHDHGEAITPVFLRMPNVVRMTGLTRSTIYRLIADRKFPRPVRLGPRAVGWRRADLDQWSAAQSSVTH